MMMQQGYYELVEGVWMPVLTVSGYLFWSPDHGMQMFRGTYRFRYVDSRGGIFDNQPSFVSDGGTKPWWSWGLFGHPFDRHMPAYYAHDGEYAHIRASGLSGRDRRRARRRADWRFRDGMRWLDSQHGIRQPLRKRIKHRVVRWFGWVGRGH